MEKQGLFKPTIIRALYKKMLMGTFTLGYIKGTAIWYVCTYASDATKNYFDLSENSTYKICVITGEIALDEDGDEYTDLSYEEALQITKALNEEAEEELFIVRRL